MAGSEPPTGGGGSEGPRWHDRDTEPIPRARPSEPVETDEDPYAGGAYQAASTDGSYQPRDGSHRPTSGGGSRTGDGSYVAGSEDDDGDSYGEPVSSGGAYYGDTSRANAAYGDASAQTIPTFTDDELNRMRGAGGDIDDDAGVDGGKIAPLDDQASRQTARYLFPTEKFRGEWRRHWVELGREAALGVLATVLMGYATGWLTKHHQASLRTAVLVIWLLIILWIVWRTADWWNDRFILTNKRVMVVRGIFTRNVAMMPLSRVTDMKYVQTFNGRLLGYGNFELESAGQDQALRNIKNLPRPNELYLRIVEEMYEPEAVEARLGRASGDEADGT